MGNYYEGELRFKFGNLPEEVERLLDYLVSEDRPEEINFHDVPFLRHPRWEYANYYKIETCGLYVEFCMKGYMYDGIDLGQSIVDYFKSYCVPEFEGGYIGHVEDEDGTYSKDFYIDVNVLLTLQNKRKFLCEGCTYTNQWRYGLCRSYNICKRAYDLGRIDQYV